jgi:hypothetical protein
MKVKDSHVSGQQTASASRRESVMLTSKQAEVARTKATILDLFKQGHTAEDSCKLAGKSPQIWKYYRRTDKDFRDQADLIVATRNGSRKVDGHNVTFEEFSEKYLKTRLFRHQLQWVDLIEGRDPRDLHPAQTYKAGDPDTIIINTPPGHAKSTTITMNYVTYKIVTDPNFRVVIISKTETMAKKFLQGIKRRLTNPQFKELIADFAPPEGFEKSAEVWTSTMIYFGHSDSTEKDPNIQVLGIGQQIYGARADLIILDDVEDLNNAHQYETHLDYIMQDVMTRDAPLLVVGTRVAPVDLYSELLNPAHYDGEESDWTHLTQPAILSATDDGEWETLWPYSDRPHPTRPGTPNEEGLWPKWDQERLSKLRRKIKPKTWALVYQQQPVSEDSLFTIEGVNGVQSQRTRGRLRAGEGNLPQDVSNFYVVAGLDPATKAGYTAAVCLAVDRNTGKRYLLDCFNAQVSPTGLRTMIFEWTEKLGIQEWRVERNSFQAFLTQDREITQYLASRGVRLREHQTHKNKWDPEWGVSSLEMLFRGYQDGTAMLDLPALAQNEAYRTFKEQLITWYPEHPKEQKTDVVMAFWFAELAARDATRDLGMTPQYHMDNPFLSGNDRGQRVVIDIDEYLRQERMAL